MAYNADTLLDRMRLKRQLRRWKISFVLAIVVFVLASVSTFADFSGNHSEYIASYKLNGFIANSDKRRDLLDKVLEGDHVKALIVHIDSPGGTVVGGENLFNQLRAISEKKPVVAVIHTMGTSAAYMTALGADRIYAHHGSITGSVGVILQLVEMTELAEKIGVNPITIKSGDLKAVPSPVEKMTPHVRETSHDIVMSFFRYFQNLVKERRQLDEETMTLVSDGRIFTGQQALDINLIDAIGSQEEAVEWLYTEKGLSRDIHVREIKERREPAEWLQQVGSRLLGWQNALFPDQQGLLSVWYPGLYQ